jgi:hypothetical protein
LPCASPPGHDGHLTRVTTEGGGACAICERRSSLQTAFAKEAAFVHDAAHLSSEDIAAATGAAPSTARAWVALKRIPSGTRAQRIAELSAISERLLRVMDPNTFRSG